MLRSAVFLFTEIKKKKISHIWAFRHARENVRSIAGASLCFPLKQLWAPRHSRCLNWPGLFYHSWCMLF